MIIILKLIAIVAVLSAIITYTAMKLAEWFECRK